MKYKNILISVGSLFLISLLGLWMGGNTIEEKIADYVAEDYGYLVDDLDYALWKNTLDITLNDTSMVVPGAEKKFSWSSGKIQLSGFDFWHYWFKGALSFNMLSWHSTSLNVVPSSTQAKRGDAMSLGIVLDNFEVNTEEIYIQHEQHEVSGKNVFLGLENIALDSAKVAYAFKGSSMDSLSIETKNKKRYSVDALRTEGRTLKLTKLSLEDKAYHPNKRLYINGNISSLEAIWDETLSLDDNMTWKEVKSSGVHISIDENGDKPLCNGMRPCKKKLLSQVLVGLPIHENVEITGSLIYRYYQYENVVSLLDIDKIYLLGKWDKPKDETASRQFNFSVKTNLNDKIDTRWSGAFYSDDRFHYSISTDPFPMAAINDMIPPQKGYYIAASTGNCSRLNIDVEGRALASTAAMILNYSDLNLDIKKDGKLGTKFLDFASKSFINNNHESSEPIIHETTFSQERSFFYQMGRHINYGFKQIIIEDWAVPLI